MFFEAKKFDNEGAKFCGNTWVDSIADKHRMFFGCKIPMKIETEYCFCGKGKALSTSKKTCDDCLSGKYQSQIEFEGECTSCIPGKFAIAVASIIATDCKDCPIGKFQANPGTPFCESCQPGTIQTLEGQSKCLDCDAGRYRQSTKDDEWTFTISPHDITASAGVTVTQTVSDVIVTGTLKTALTGGDTKSIVVTATTESDSFISSENIVIATGSPRTIAHADITSVGKVTPTDPTICVGCPAGWSSEKAASRCNKVPSGSHLVGTLVEVCKENHYCLGEAEPEKECLAGTLSAVGSFKCLACEAGMYSGVVGQACKTCGAGQYRPSKKDDEWTFTITAQDITASAGVAVTQNVSGDIVTGILKTALTGADTKIIVVAATTGGSFITKTDVVIGTGDTALTIAHSTITNAGKITPTNPTFCKLQFLFIYIHISNTY